MNPETQYDWKMKWLSKGIPAEAAVKEMERILALHGVLTAQTVLAASTPPDALLHSLFEWEDTRAATQFRLQQAREIINNVQVIVISDGQTRKIDVYEVVNKGTDRTYKDIRMLSDDEILQVKDEILKDLNIVKSKLSLYQRFNSIIPKIQELVNEINTIAPSKLKKKAA